MAVAIACDKCGKRYSVNESALGKRVTCKQCAHTFVAKAAESKPAAAPASTARAVTKAAAAAPVATPPKPVVKAAKVVVPSKPARPKAIPVADDADDWSALESAATGPEVVDAPAATIAPKRTVSVGESAASAAAFLSRFSAGTITRMCAVLLALLFVLGTLVTPTARVAGELFFVCGSFVYFFIGLIVIIVRGLRAEGEGGISPGAVIGLLFSVILSVLARRAIILVRGGRGGGIPGRKILGLFGNAVFIFLMVIVVGMLPNIFGSYLAQPAPLQPRFPVAGAPNFPQQQGHYRPQPIADRFTPDQIATVKITGLQDSANQGSWLCSHLNRIAGSGSAEGSAGGPPVYEIRLAPITDLNGLANKIDFGAATVQAESRTISVEADTAKLDELLAADPNYHPHNARQNAQPAASDDKATAAKPMPNPAAPGMKVLVHWGSKWWPATVIRMDGDKYRIHYDGEADAFDESVGNDRIQPAK